jgi:hypothetical protein
MSTDEADNLHIISYVQEGKDDNTPLFRVSKRLYEELKSVKDKSHDLFDALDALDMLLKRHALLVAEKHTKAEETSSLKEVHNAARSLMLAFPGLHGALMKVRKDKDNE